MSPALRYVGYPVRYLQPLPILWATCLFFSLSLFLTRKHTDRWALWLLPLPFLLAYLQAYLYLGVHALGSSIEFTLIQNLYYSGTYDHYVSTPEAWTLTGFGSLGLLLFSLLLFLFIRNSAIAVGPFILSVLYTVVYGLTRGMYASFDLPVRLYPLVMIGRDLFHTEFHLMDMAVKLLVVALLFAVYNQLNKVRAGKREKNRKQALS